MNNKEFTKGGTNNIAATGGQNTQSVTALSSNSACVEAQAKNISAKAIHAWVRDIHFYIITLKENDNASGGAYYMTYFVVSRKHLKKMEETYNGDVSEVHFEAGALLMKEHAKHTLEEDAKYALQHRGYLMWLLGSRFEEYSWL